MTRMAPTLLNKIRRMLDERAFSIDLSETRIPELFEKLIGSKIEEIHDVMKKLQCNQQIDDAEERPK